MVVRYWGLSKLAGYAVLDTLATVLHNTPDQRMQKTSLLPRTLRIALGAMALSMACLAPASASDFDSAIAIFAKARSGDNAATEQAVAAFQGLLRNEPDNALVMAYAGVSTAMQANGTMMPWKKLGFAKEGIAIIDKAVALLAGPHSSVPNRKVPDVMEVRLLAARTYLAMPDSLGKGAAAAKLIQEVMANPLFAGATANFRAETWFAAAGVAKAEKRHDDARKYLNDVIALNTPLTDAARSMLKEIT